jgi:DNA-binding ferritin-like protein (Dps family)
VEQEWQRYDFRVGNLPDEMRARFERIQAEALTAARAAGWDPDGDLADEAD